MARKTSLSDLLPDRIVPAASGDSVKLWIYSAFPKYDWVPHSSGDRIRVDHPGSALTLAGKHYEFMCVEKVTEGDYRFRYGLRAWDTRYVIRHVVHYTPETQMANAAAYLEGIKTDRLRNRILWLFPLAGLAPDPLQREWGKRTGLNMAWVSAGSALFGMGLAFLLRGASEAMLFEAAVLFLALESFARLFWIGMTRKPHGTLLLTGTYLLWEGLTGAPPRFLHHLSAGEILKRQDLERQDAEFRSQEQRSPTPPSDLVHSFSFFWGIYPRRDQMRLQLRYGHDGTGSTAVTAGIFLAMGLLELCLSFPLYHLTLLTLAGPAYLVTESVWRLYQAKKLGQPAGSVLGYLLRLVIRPPG